MTQSTFQITVTQSEGDYLIYLLTRDQIRGDYYGNKRQYDARIKRLLKKLHHAKPAAVAASSRRGQDAR